jgi:N-formylglutamate deformylase
MSMTANGLEIRRGETPLVVSFPHTGIELPAEFAARLVSPWLARKDTDWYVERLYAMAIEFGATTVRTTISRTVIDVNRDPSGASLYPGQVTTALCPTETFDGEPLYRPGQAPDDAQIAARRARFFEPYHAALAQEIERLRARHGRVVLYDAHAIRSRVPRLFRGELPHLNIGTNRGAGCAAALIRLVEQACEDPHFSRVTDGRFVGGWTTRRYGAPRHNVHALQMELACRGYLDEPVAPDPGNWPPPFEPARAAALSALLRRVLAACANFAVSDPGAGP